VTRAAAVERAEKLQAELEAARVTWNAAISSLHVALSCPAEGLSMDELVEWIEELSTRVLQLSSQLHVYDAIAGDGDRNMGEKLRARITELEAKLKERDKT